MVPVLKLASSSSSRSRFISIGSPLEPLSLAGSGSLGALTISYVGEVGPFRIQSGDLTVEWRKTAGT